MLCIDASKTSLKLLKHGEIYVVTSEANIFGLDCYLLEEIPGQPYTQDRFLPLSDIDETELLKQREPEHVAV